MHTYCTQTCRAQQCRTEQSTTNKHRLAPISANKAHLARGFVSQSILRKIKNVKPMEPEENPDDARLRGVENLLAEELHAAFLNDRTRLGEVYACLDRGLSDSEIQTELELATVGTIGHIKRSIRAIRDNWNPPGLGPATKAKNDLSRLLREFNFSEGVRSLLRVRFDELEANVTKLLQDRLGSEANELQRENSQPNRIVAGVYVWTINTYLSFPDDRNQVWFRIGQSEDVLQRMRQHRQEVKLPEPLFLYRVYSHASHHPSDLEDKFHQICQNAEHTRAIVRGRDREWFCTNLDFLDFFAEQIGCQRHDELCEPDL